MRLPFLRYIGPVASLVGILAFAYFGTTEGIDLSVLDQTSNNNREHDKAGSQQVSTTQMRFNDRIRIASFNIQVFGEKKSNNRVVMGQLAEIFSEFDLIAVQEIRSPKTRPIQRLVELLKRQGRDFDFRLSSPIGRSAQKEQYAFVWNTRRIRIVPDSTYIVEDSEDRMHREPMVASFQAVVDPKQGRVPFGFTLINVHTDPDEVRDELNVLDDVFVSVRNYEQANRHEEDIILLGDLNVNHNELQQLGKVPSIASIIDPNYQTNTVGNRVYDHIIIDRFATQEFTKRSGVYDYTEALKLTHQQAVKVSDHRPIWAEFSAFEVIGPVAMAHNATDPY